MVWTRAHRPGRGQKRDLTERGNKFPHDVWRDRRCVKGLTWGLTDEVRQAPWPEGEGRGRG